MKEKIKNCFERLQKVQIESTIENMESMLQTLYDLRSVYQEMLKEGGEDAIDLQ